MSNLRPGDILSYSAGSTQTGPDGYRFARRDGAGRGVNLVAAVHSRWADLEILACSPLMFINTYPAYIGDFKQGVQVDTYLSPRTADRALALAAREELTAIVLGQPLFTAEVLLGERNWSRPLPANVILWVGGYALPSSLQHTMVQAAGQRECSLSIVQFYGAAEVDAACLMGRDLDDDGRVIYNPRGEDVRTELRGDILHLQRRDASGTWSEPFDTGDHARHKAGGLVLTPNYQRLAPEVWTELEGWSSHEWQRRTGYVDYTSEGFHFQLREGYAPSDSRELGFHDYCRRTGMSWLAKPRWRMVRAST